MLDPVLALKLRTRPIGNRLMKQRWTKLTFIHFTVEPDLIQSTLPPGLTVDTFPDSAGTEKAWIGLVPFEIEDLTFALGLKVPTASRFLETNIRTYVHHHGKDPGVWFYSLDAASRLACKGARLSYSLPYWHARMALRNTEGVHHYQGERFTDRNIRYEAEVVEKEPMQQPQPGSLEFFLVERYLLYSFKAGRLYSGRVHHQPYPLKEVELCKLNQSLTDSLGLPVKSPESVLYSPGVEVDVFGLKPET